MVSTKKKQSDQHKQNQTESDCAALNAEPQEFLDLQPPDIPQYLDNVLLIFANNVPEDARFQCVITSTGQEYPRDGSGVVKRTFLVNFVRERLEMIISREYSLWLNGRLPFITPRELLLWRLRQYVEYIWAFQLPEDEDLALIFNTTKLRAAHVASDFIARFRKALMFPIALRRLYRILRNQDPIYRMTDPEYLFKNAYGPVFLVPSRRYEKDANSLIDEFRVREEGFLRNAAFPSKTENKLWIHDHVMDLVDDDKIRDELFLLYKIPREAGYEG